MKKRLFFAFVAVILCCSFVFVFYLSRHKISLMNEQECIQYLKSAGVNISENYDITVIKKQLSELETDSDHPAQLMSTPDRFYEQIRVLVKMYYNEPELSENTVLSKMDKNEFRVLLDGVIQEAQQLGIPTLTPSEIERLRYIENER